jgi:pimeloyl-ACP methyl ester carboxylesterase
MKAWPSDEIIANGIKIRYHRTGGDKPPLVIAHGVTDNGLSWSRFAGAMEDRYDVVLYDAWGHGFSDAPPNGYTFEDHAEDLTQFIAALDLERPNVLGHSGGAVAAAIVAASHPDLLSKLILEDPSWGTNWGGWENTTRGLTKWFQAVVSMSRQELVTMCQETNPQWREEEISLWADSKVQVSPHVAQSFKQPEPSWRNIIPKITCPLLLIAGDPENGVIITQKDIAEMASIWNQGRVISITDAGHQVHYDQYEAFIEIVERFLEEPD